MSCANNLVALNFGYISCQEASSIIVIVHAKHAFMLFIELQKIVLISTYICVNTKIIDNFKATSD